MILTVADIPINFIEDTSVKTKSSIGLKWQKAITINGGTDVIDYRINYDQGTGNFILL